MSGVAICGIGHTEYSRNSGRSAVRLALEAVLAACEDAGLPVDLLDGVVPVHPGLHADDVIANLRLPDVSFTARTALGGATSVASLGLAAMALRSGAAKYIALVVGRRDASGPPIAELARQQIPNQELRAQLERPHGWETPAQYYSMICRRHMAEFGTTKHQLGLVSVAMRDHAQRNPRAMMYGRPITLEDYIASPVVADPYQRLDCCLMSDGGAAVILTTTERAADLRQAPVIVEAVAQGKPSSPDDLTNRQNWYEIGLGPASRRAYAEAGVGPLDMSAAMIYDCFTFELIHQLEEAGFCARGEGGPFVESGAIRLDGRLPVNTHGGLMSEGHMGGLNHVVEAAVQLRGAGGERQVVGARWIAVTGWGDLGDGSMALLRAEGA